MESYLRCLRTAEVAIQAQVTGRMTCVICVSFVDYARAVVDAYCVRQRSSARKRDDCSVSRRRLCLYMIRCSTQLNSSPLVVDELRHIIITMTSSFKYSNVPAYASTRSVHVELSPSCLLAFHSSGYRRTKSRKPERHRP